MPTSRRNRPAAALIIFSLAVSAQADDAPAGAQVIDEIVVTADYRGRSVGEIPSSLSVLGADAVDELAVQHFEELVYAVPNLNWSGDGHRARYFQIRGVGELEQYQGAPNPSVGFLVDDIDFSGIGTIATLFDIERIEVLRGPQGSRYGANALAGLIYVQSAMPTAEPSARLRVTAGQDDAFAGGIAVGGPVTGDEALLYRFSAHHHSSDGFRDNEFLGRSDTNGRDETTLRGRLSYVPTDSLDVNLALMYADIDDGYDAFAIDNGYTMRSDNPGRDAQQSVGASLKMEWSGLDGLMLTSITAVADSDIDFGFDADWGNADSWSPYTYDYVSQSDRARRTLSQELRIASDTGASFDYLLGLYAMRLDDELETHDRGEYYDPFFDLADSLDAVFASDYQALNLAAFGQVGIGIGDATRLSIGLRVERRLTDYRDSNGLDAGPAETMTGGEVALTHEFSPTLSSYVNLSRGYKAGGFNLGVAVPEDRREFGAEALWNAEIGIRSSWLDDTLRVDASAFVNRRDDQQVRSSFQLDPGDPTTFIFLTDNAATGDSYGLEADVRWFPGDAFELYLAVGLLDATFDRYIAPQGDLSGRDQAHAPNYTLALGGAYRHPSGWYARVDTSARDAFYFDVSHDQRSEAYALANLRVGFDAESWSAELWLRNAFDTEYAVRGFYFGNEPPDFPPILYTRLGDPRQLGVTFERRF